MLPTGLAGGRDPDGLPGRRGAPLAEAGAPPPVSRPVEPGLLFFSGPNPIGGPVGDGYRGVSRLRLPYYEAILHSSGPIGVFAVSIAGDPVGQPPGRGGEPIGRFFLGFGGAPIGVDTMGGGGLPIEAPQAVARAEAQLQPRTALVGAATATTIVPPAVAFGG